VRGAVCHEWGQWATSPTYCVELRAGNRLHLQTPTAQLRRIDVEGEQTLVAVVLLEKRKIEQLSLTLGVALAHTALHIGESLAHLGESRVEMSDDRTKLARDLRDVAHLQLGLLKRSDAPLESSVLLCINEEGGLCQKRAFVRYRDGSGGDGGGGEGGGNEGGGGKDGGGEGGGGDYEGGRRRRRRLRRRRRRRR